jgi:hypothetical protein
MHNDTTVPPETRQHQTTSRSDVHITEEHIGGELVWRCSACPQRGVRGTGLVVRQLSGSTPNDEVQLWAAVTLQVK